jgi:hypothetical protein
MPDRLCRNTFLLQTHPDRLHLEFQSALGPFFRFTHFFRLELIFNHQLSSTFFGGKVKRKNKNFKVIF